MIQSNVKRQDGECADFLYLLRESFQLTEENIECIIEGKSFLILMQH